MSKKVKNVQKSLKRPTSLLSSESSHCEVAECAWFVMVVWSAWTSSLVVLFWMLQGRPESSGHVEVEPGSYLLASDLL